MSVRFILLMSLVSLNGVSQNIDSLQFLLKRPNDTVKVNSLNRLSELYLRKGLYEKSGSAALEAKRIAEEISYPLGEYWAYKHLYTYDNAKAQFANCLNWLGKSMDVADKLGRTDLMVESKLQYASTLGDMHFTAKALQVSLEACSIATRLNNKRITALALSHLAGAYFNIGDLRRSISYDFQLVDLWKELNEPATLAIVYSNTAEVYSNLHNYDSAIYFHKKAIDTYEKTGETINMAYLLAMRARTYVEAKDYNLALFYFNKAIYWHKEKRPAVSTYAYSLLNISEITLKQSKKEEKYFQLNYEKLKADLDTAIQLFKSYDNYPFLFRAYSALREINERTGNYKVANDCSKQLLVIKDSLNNREQKTKLNELMVQHQVKENEQKIIQLRETTNAYNLINFLLAGLVLVGFLSAVLFVSRQKMRYRNEKKQLEMTALLSQMNPHFIFNCLNSINRHIIKSQIDEATQYLTTFAKLMRSILDNSSCSLITLETEIKTITMYLQLEAMRFSNKFDYSVNAAPEIDLEQVKLPPMIIQPFIENAILHGIQHKRESGTININFGLKEDFLLCTIEDDGVGRQRASEIEKPHHSNLRSESHGIRITKERLQLLSKKKSKTFIEINDRLDENNNVAGTKVEIGIPILL